MIRLIIPLFSGIIKIFKKQPSVTNRTVEKSRSLEDSVNTVLFLYGGSVFDSKHEKTSWIFVCSFALFYSVLNLLFYY